MAIPHAARAIRDRKLEYPGHDLVRWNAGEQRYNFLSIRHPLCGLVRLPANWLRSTRSQTTPHALLVTTSNPKRSPGAKIFLQFIYEAEYTTSFHNVQLFII